MKQILIIGAGKSSAHLVKFLAENTSKYEFKLVVLDLNFKLIPLELFSNPQVEFTIIKSASSEILTPFISISHIVISMLPASFHFEVAKLCLSTSTHLITPSYISDDMKSLDIEAKEKNLIFLNEMGFDPGIDHMTTMKICHEIESKGGQLISYRSYAGGLVAADSDDNPWHYKFSWNPRNVILSGQGGEIVYRDHGQPKKLNYQTLFSNAESIKLDNGQSFDAYANRDSLKYLEIYQWESIQTILRGTLRYPGFCRAWNILIQLGITDEKKNIGSFLGKSYRTFYQYFIENQDIESFLNKFDADIQEKLQFIGMLDAETLISTNAENPAQILQSILELKWKLGSEDKDWVVMVHFLEYVLDGKLYKLESSLSLEGETNLYTAMSKTVGMPIAYAALLILEDKIKSRGVILPITDDIYLPILDSLDKDGMKFQEFEVLTT